MAETQSLTLSLTGQNVQDPNFFYGTIALIDNIPHKSQLEFTRTFELDEFESYTKEDRLKLFQCPDEWVSLTEQNTLITNITVPSDYVVELSGDRTFTLPQWHEDRIPPTNDDEQRIIVRRRTASEIKMVTWSAGTRWSWTRHNLIDDQLIHLIQEIIDRLDHDVYNVSDGGAPPLIDGPLNMRGYYIYNLGMRDEPQGGDAVNLEFADDRYVALDSAGQVDGYAKLEDTGEADAKVPVRHLPSFGPTGQVLVIDTPGPLPPDPADYAVGSVWIDPDIPSGVDDVYWNIYNQQSGLQEWRITKFPALGVNAAGIAFVSDICPHQENTVGGFEPGSIWLDALDIDGNGTGRWYIYLQSELADDPLAVRGGATIKETGFWVDLGAVDGTAFSGGGATAQAIISPTPPPDPGDGVLWWNTLEAQIFLWNGIEWVSA